MISDFISVGDKIELQKIRMNDSGLLENKIYISQLLDFMDSDKAKIAMPIIKSRIVPLSIGDKYILCFYTNKGLFQCTAVITARSKIHHIYILEVQFLSELEKYQRRQFYRLSCNLEMTYHIITDVEKILLEQLKMDQFQNEDEKKTMYGYD